MKLLVPVNAADDMGEEDYAIVDFDLDIAQKISARRRILKAAIGGDPELYASRYWFSGSITWFDKKDAFPEDFLELLEKADYIDEAYVIVPDEMDLSFLEEADAKIDIEAQQLVIEAEGFSWLCYDKYSGIQLATQSFGYDILAKWL
jgi:hypothetical protein